MRIVVDAMGSDNRPLPDVAGALRAARDSRLEITLAGDRACIEDTLRMQNARGTRLEIVHASQAITMADRPTEASRDKPDSSMHVGMRMVRDGQAQAFVSMGNTGAALTIATLFTLRRIRGVRRPAISGIFPIGAKKIILLDIGANADARPDWLLQFARMGEIYARMVLRVARPMVGLLSIGSEQGKGSEMVRRADRLLRASGLCYQGNVEPEAVFRGSVDVIVSDGFVGNMLVKTYEAASAFTSRLIREETRADPWSRLAGMLMRPVFARVRRRANTSEIGGAPLLGVNGVVIIGHGSADAFTVENAIRQAAQAVDSGMLEAIRAGLQTNPESSGRGEQ